MLQESMSRLKQTIVGSVVRAALYGVAFLFAIVATIHALLAFRAWLVETQSPIAANAITAGVAAAVALLCILLARNRGAAIAAAPSSRERSDAEIRTTSARIMSGSRRSLGRSFDWARLPLSPFTRALAMTGAAGLAGLGGGVAAGRTIRSGKGREADMGMFDRNDVGVAEAASLLAAALKRNAGDTARGVRHEYDRFEPEVRRNVEGAYRNVEGAYDSAISTLGSLVTAGFDALGGRRRARRVAHWLSPRDSWSPNSLASMAANSPQRSAAIGVGILAVAIAATWMLARGDAGQKSGSSGPRFNP